MIVLSMMFTASILSRAGAFAAVRLQPWHATASFALSRKYLSGRNRMFATPGSEPNQPDLEPMSNLYQAWTIEQDRLLYENRREPIPRLAALLGRGLRGVEARLDKITDINSAAYARLFVEEDDTKSINGSTPQGGKLTPAKEVLRRIRWDGTLDQDAFAILHYDRVDEKIVETPFTASNDSIQGNEDLFVFALPEHRITGVKFKERVVWDKAKRIDCVFGSMNGNGETIDQVAISYDEWKNKKDEEEELNRRRQSEVSDQIKFVLGDERFAVLKSLSSALLSRVPMDDELDNYLKSAQGVFRLAREETTHIPRDEIESLDLISELVALLPDDDLRQRILCKIEIKTARLEGRPQKGGSNSAQELPDLKESDIEEQFIRGSGAGGQKINKTSNRVILVHTPTQVRVECQETRSLSQNRKIARKRLRLKVDEFLNGDNSRVKMKAAKAVSKKARAKAKNKARRKKKAAAKES
eukprot:CAMPEP_0113547322 /NCGR_PEP_ID=MMETSP0015_2-20120614/12291_1 /TAXON_ID=2838 /ORGANISM="Odontella" /LENGTH=470 /DNA_ID=CAMNT_0000447863 /DNA_START=130 /DNA_END=1542 /DNA_ORIENTATION=+ /assembly_acc=CAM_ASM_000160